MKIVFLPNGWDDYPYWQEHNRKQLKRINRLIEACRRDPFHGIGKPEPLKHERAGWWSRRIDEEHRFVYQVEGTDEETSLQVLNCRHHY
jgi:toxin YoeB